VRLGNTTGLRVEDLRLILAMYFLLPDRYLSTEGKAAILGLSLWAATGQK
jgi:hypothetical protein